MTFATRSIKTLSLVMATIGLGASLVTPAFANHESTYFALEGTALSVGSSSSPNLNFEPVGVRFKVGSRLSQAFDIEAQFTASSDDSTSLIDQFDTTIAGVYLKAHLPLGFRSALYGLGGYNWTKLTSIDADREFVDRQSGFSYGFGVETQLSSNIDLSADFMRYSQGDEGEFDEISSINFGVKVYF